MILVRATKLTERTACFGDQLAEASGLNVAFILDGRHKVAVKTSRPLVLITRSMLEAMGLFCPPDFAWRCGDYGMYVAHQLYPAVPFFWQIEYDVRIGGDNTEFFRRFRHIESDMLAADYRPADPSYRWFSFSSGRNVTPYRCLFPVIRLSSRALSTLFEKRLQHAKYRQRRATWPNDEGFVATSLTASNFSCSDFNDYGDQIYDDATFSYFQPIRGEGFEPSSDLIRLYHPVLYDGDYERKMTLLRTRPSPLKFPARIEQRVRRPLNHLATW